MSNRLLEELKALGLSASAQVNERLAPKLGMHVKAPTLLRYLRAIPPPAKTSVRVLGIDDFAMKRGNSYGTILVNIETSKPLTLLPDRTAEAVWPWLKSHQEIEVVSRDRASAYADAVKRALPHATQVADRYHLVQNLREHLQQFLDRKRTWLPEMEESPLQAVSTDDRDRALALETQSSIRTSHPSPSTASASSTEQPAVEVQPDLPHGQMGEEMELASLTYAERKKKISRDNRYARVRAGPSFAPSGNGTASDRTFDAHEQTYRPSFSHLGDLPGTRFWLWTASQEQEEVSPLSGLSA